MIVRFGLISGLGWMIDYSLFALLCSLPTNVWVANVASASFAVIFVFFASKHHVFEYEGGYLIVKLIAYFVYQAGAILMASFLIEALTYKSNIEPILSKILITPITFYLNFQFMSLITTGKMRLI